MFDLYNEFRTLIAALDEHQIDYAICGGLAMAIYDRPRATVAMESGKLSVVSREGLISLKTMRGSAQDQADILALQEDVDDATS